MPSTLTLSAAQMAALITSRLPGDHPSLNTVIIPANLASETEYSLVGTQLRRVVGSSYSRMPGRRPYSEGQVLYIREPLTTHGREPVAELLIDAWKNQQEMLLPASSLSTRSETRAAIQVSSVTLKRLGALSAEDALDAGVRKNGEHFTAQATAINFHPGPLEALKDAWTIEHPDQPWNDRIWVWLIGLHQLSILTAHNDPKVLNAQADQADALAEQAREVMQTHHNHARALRQEAQLTEDLSAYRRLAPQGPGQD